MKIVQPCYEIVEPEVSLNQYRILRLLEAFGRVCYDSAGDGSLKTQSEFVRKIIDRGHLSVIEHLSVTVIASIDRGVSHEWVRHRIASYSQRSTRYCNEGKNGISFIKPVWMDSAPDDEIAEFQKDLEFCESLYNKWLVRWADPVTGKQFPERARYFLPNGLRTVLVATHNLREWRHIFELRDSKAAHPSMREIMHMIHEDFSRRAPIIFPSKESE